MRIMNINFEQNVNNNGDIINDDDDDGGGGGDDNEMTNLGFSWSGMTDDFNDFTRYYSTF